MVLVKNIPFRTEESDLHQLFQRFGELGRVIFIPLLEISTIFAIPILNMNLTRIFSSRNNIISINENILGCLASCENDCFD